MLRSLLIVVGLLLPIEASANDKTPCWIIRSYVRLHGEQAALKWAKAQNYSERDIQRAKRCLK